MKKFLTLALAAVLVAGGAWTLLGGHASHADAAAGGPPPAPVGVARVVAESVQEWDEFNGRISAIDTVEIRPRVSGYVERLAFKEGDEVKIGQLLFVIDQRPYRDALDNATAQLERARATAAQALSQDRRGQTLLAGKAMSGEEAETRHSTYAQAAADVHAAEAAVATAKLNLEFTEVRAPVAGRTSRAILTVGNLAQADQTLLTTVVSQNPVYVYFDCDEQSFLRYQALVRDGQRSDTANPVHVALAGETGFPHQGRVDFLDNQVNAATGTIRARAVLDNAQRIYTPGLYARVQLAGRSDSHGLLIDDKAVLTDQDRKYVYVLGPADKALRKDIQIGRLVNGLRMVDGGLQPGDKVIVQGQQMIFFPGAPVKPTEVPMRQEASIATAAPAAVAAQ